MTLPPMPVLIVMVTVGALLLVMFVRAVRETIALRRAGRAIGREYDMARIAAYLDESPHAGAAMPARAWADLDMDDVYRAIDRTVGVPGRQLLHARLRREDHTFATLRAFDTAVTRVADDAALARRLRTALAPLDFPRVDALSMLFRSPPAPVPVVFRALPLLTLTGVALLVASLRWHQLLPGVAIAILANVFVRVAMRERIDHVVPGLGMLPALLRASSRLMAEEAPELSPHTDALRASAPRLQWLARVARWLSFEPRGGNEIAGYVYEYVNMLLLLDVISYVWSVDAIRAEGETIRRVYVAAGALDVIQSVATLRGEARRWSRPVFIARTERCLEATAVTHPLLDEPVANSLVLGRSMLLTGSNMSGKSTFIRALGVNAILARTIHTTFAERWRAPLLATRTSIGRADSLLQGTSYYRAEVDAVGALLQAAPGTQRLILVDELFRGTNSVERIAAAKAVLEHLDRSDDLVVVATHDVELIPMLPSYAQYHFREEVRDGALTFDYRLHDGPTSTRNALAILALAGYPASVVEDATRTAAQVERSVTGIRDKG